MMDIRNRITHCQERLSMLIERFLPSEANNTSTLFSAMRYACLNGGKRLRPLLVYLTGELFDIHEEPLDAVALAAEFIHCYSLIHDDLPAMDNDDLRRGKPTCHKAFDEATAILAGDALLTLAFDLLATPAFFPLVNESANLKIIKVYSEAAGAQGMVLGQSLDMAAQEKLIDLDKLIQMHSAKTGALIAASVQCGALATGKASEQDLSDLKQYGKAIGLAFQIQDDILDALGNSDAMGKHSGQDVKKNKCTFVTLLGLHQAIGHAKACHQQALNSLQRFGPTADPLRALSTYIIERMA